ncbi:MAG: molybdopterin-dependent oxidoreductase [Eubacteriales bacterium]
MKKISKSTLVVIISIAVLVTAVAVFAFLNADDIGKKQEMEMNAEFMIKYGDASWTITMQDMLDLEPVEFNTTMDTSTTDPTQVVFSGVELKTICESIGLDISSSEVFEVRALDGYSSALKLDEVMEDGNVYICISMNEEPLKIKSEGGKGPYMMVIKSAQFSQRWCKFVQEIDIR